MKFRFGAKPLTTFSVNRNVCFYLTFLTILSKTIFCQDTTPEASKLFDQTVVTTLQDTSQYIDARIEIAKAFIARGQYQSAINTLNNALNDDRKNSRVWFQLGMAYLQRTDNKNALKSFDKAIQYNGNNAQYFLYRGITLYKLNDFDKALSVLGQTLSLARTNDEKRIEAQAWLWKGRSHQAQGDSTNADKSYQRTLNLQPNDKDAKTYLTRLRNGPQLIAWYQAAEQALSQADWETVETNYRNIITLEPSYKDAAQKLERVKKQKQAQALANSIDKQTKQLSTLYQQADKALGQKGWKIAETYYKNIVDLDSAYKDVSQKLRYVQNQRKAEVLADSTAKRIKKNAQQQQDSLSNLIANQALKESTKVIVPPFVVHEASQAKDSTKNDTKLAVNSDAPVKPSSKPAFTISTLPKVSREWLTALIAGFLMIAIVFISFRKYRSRQPADISVTQPVASDRNKSMFSRIFTKFTKIFMKLTKTEVIRPTTVSGPPQLERYPIQKEAGLGGMGKVYKAEDLKLGRTVAVKVIRELNIDTDEAKESIKRFHQEARATAQLNHPNIVSLYDIIETDGVLCMIMEYVDGLTLGDMIKEKKQLDLSQSLTIVEKVCMALDYAHDKGIIHRDIKPSNIMITRDGSVKVLDFGLAKMLTSENWNSYTITGTLLGTPPYMSPEQIETEELDRRSDIFSLGIIFYEMLTSKNPFVPSKKCKLGQIFNAILNTAPPKLTQIRPDILPELEAIVEKMLAKKREQRYNSGKEIIDLLSTLEAVT